MDLSKLDPLVTLHYSILGEKHSIVLAQAANNRYRTDTILDEIRKQLKYNIRLSTPLLRGYDCARLAITNSQSTPMSSDDDYQNLRRCIRHPEDGLGSSDLRWDKLPQQSDFVTLPLATTKIAVVVLRMDGYELVRKLCTVHCVGLGDKTFGGPQAADFTDNLLFDHDNHEAPHPYDPGLRQDFRILPDFIARQTEHKRGLPVSLCSDSKVSVLNQTRTFSGQTS
jgi:hypothetical protein